MWCKNRSTVKAVKNMSICKWRKYVRLDKITWVTKTIGPTIKHQGIFISNDGKLFHLSWIVNVWTSVFGLVTVIGGRIILRAFKRNKKWLLCPRTTWIPWKGTHIRYFRTIIIKKYLVSIINQWKYIFYD